MQATTGPGARWAARSLIAAFVCLSVAVLFGERTTITFDTDDPGRPPTGFAFVLTGQGRPGSGSSGRMTWRTEMCWCRPTPARPPIGYLWPCTTTSPPETSTSP
jgi:hypothetical protein